MASKFNYRRIHFALVPHDTKLPKQCDCGGRTHLFQRNLRCSDWEAGKISDSLLGRDDAQARVARCQTLEQCTESWVLDSTFGFVTTGWDLQRVDAVPHQRRTLVSDQPRQTRATIAQRPTWCRIPKKAKRIIDEWLRRTRPVKCPLVIKRPIKYMRRILPSCRSHVVHPAVNKRRLADTAKGNISQHGRCRIIPGFGKLCNRSLTKE